MEYNIGVIILGLFLGIQWFSLAMLHKMVENLQDQIILMSDHITKIQLEEEIDRNMGEEALKQVGQLFKELHPDGDDNFIMGIWEKDKDEDYYECSLCGGQVMHRGPQCPHCGSRMIMEAADETN